MSKEPESQLSQKKFAMKVKWLDAGWMFVDVTVNGKTFERMFDQDVSDPTINLMETYLAVRDYTEDGKNVLLRDNNIYWMWDDRTTFYVHIVRMDDDRYKISIEDDEFPKEDVVLSKTEFLAALDDFFQSILDNPGFPYQYPVGTEADDDTLDKAEQMYRSIFELLPEEVRHEDDVYYGIKSICINAMVKVYPEAQAYADDYRKMLETYTIPKRWERWK